LRKSVLLEFETGREIFMKRLKVLVEEEQ